MQCAVAIQLDCFVALLLAMTDGVQPVFAALAIHRMRGRVRLLFFDWFAPSPITFPIFGGVLDSTLGSSAPLPVESRGSLVKTPAKKIIGNIEEMPMAA